MPTIDTILFDIGGVLVDTHDFPIRPEWQSGPATLDEMRHTWLESTIAHAFERGELSAQVFAEQYIDKYQLVVPTELFLKSFYQWPKGLYQGVIEFITTLRTHFQIAVFSNCNELHWDRLMHEMDLQNRFDHFFASHLLGRVKPDVAAFTHVAEQMDRTPEQILFLDDAKKNVSAAKTAGLHAEHVIGFQNARATLVDRFGEYINSTAH